MDEINKLVDNMLITLPCNICNLPNNNKNKNICISCIKILTPHFANCNCIYCK